VSPFPVSIVGSKVDRKDSWNLLVDFRTNSPSST
jgi:hypothetical protein